MLFCIGAVPASQEHDAWWNIYFTAPGAGRSGDNGRNPESGLVALIREAKTSVHEAFYEVSAPAVVTALCAAESAAWT